MPCSNKKYDGAKLVRHGSVTMWVSSPRDEAEEGRLAERMKREGARKAEARDASRKRSFEKKKRDLERRRVDSYRPAANPDSHYPPRPSQYVESMVMNAPRGLVVERPVNHTKELPGLSTQSSYSTNPGAQISVVPRPAPAPKGNAGSSNASSENSVLDRLEKALFYGATSIQPSGSQSIQNNTSGQTQQAALADRLLIYPTLVRQSPMVSDPFFPQPKIASEQNGHNPKEIDDRLLPPTPTSDAPSPQENAIQESFLLQPSIAQTSNSNPIFLSLANKENSQENRFGQPSQPPPTNVFLSSSSIKEHIPELGSNEETVPELRRRLVFWHEAWEKHDRELAELKELQRAKNTEILRLREERILKNKELDWLKHLLATAEEVGRTLEERNLAAMRALEGRP